MRQATPEGHAAGRPGTTRKGGRDGREGQETGAALAFDLLAPSQAVAPT